MLQAHELAAVNAALVESHAEAEQRRPAALLAALSDTRGGRTQASAGATTTGASTAGAGQQAVLHRALGRVDLALASAAEAVLEAGLDPGSLDFCPPPDLEAAAATDLGCEVRATARRRRPS